MRTRHILAALALPAMFVACTNDEFEQVQSLVDENPVLEGRAKGRVTLIAEKEKAAADADTRVVGSMTADDGINWLWEGPEDKLGAVVVDYAAGGAIVDSDVEGYKDYAITNYPFAPQISGQSASANFATPTAVVSGAYMFYNKYNGNATERRVISHEISRLATVSEGTDAGLTQVGTNKDAGGQNFFVSPIIDLAIADGSNIAKPVSLTSVYSILHFKFKTDLVGDYYNKGFKINKIVLKTLGKNDKNEKDQFMRKLTLNPAKLAQLQTNLGRTHSGLFKPNGAINAMHISDEQVREALGLVNAAIADPANEIGLLEEGTEDLVYQLKDPIVFTSKDQTKHVMVILPAGTYHKATGLSKYGGKTEGVLQMTVYTSEGTYDNYIGTEDMTFMRGKKYNVSRELIINGGKTNINLFDPNQSFNIETTADYNYVIDYIKDHFRDFGNASNWKTPVLNFEDGKTIEVDDAHYFPEFPVKYLGGATLKLTGKDQTYSFQPKNVILGKDENLKGRPTIEVADESTTMLFEEDVITGTGLKDGENVTAAVKLISAGKVEVAAGKEVHFELLDSKKQLEINENAKIETAATGELTTAGVVNLKEGAVLNAKSSFENAAVMTIEAQAKANLAKRATNSGKITVKGLGELKSTNVFTNSAEGSILVESCDLQYMNSKDRAKAIFKVLTNAGEITIKESGDRKGTYGGLMTVEQKLTNSGEISNNGELNIKQVANSGTITLESDPYALLAIESGAATTGTKGSIVLADATQYEMFDNYYTGRNAIADVTGVVETTLDQKAYDEVMANHTNYNQQETAWSVLTQITVTGKLDLEAEMADRNKKFILPDNASINALQALTVCALEVTGKGAALSGKAVTVDGSSSTVPGAGLVNIKTGAELTNNVVMTIGQSTAPITLDVAGKLVNKGTIDTTDGEGGDAVGDFAGVNRVMANVGGELVNEGKLSKKATAKYSGAGYKAVQKLINELKVSDKQWKGFWGNNKPRVDMIEANTVEELSGKLWNTDWESKNINITETILKNILKSDVYVMIDGYQAIALKQKNGPYYALYLGGNRSEQPANAAFKAALKEEGLVNTAVDIAKGGTMPYPCKTWFYIKNNTGIVDLLKAADDKNSWAYGEISDNSRGTKKGKFNNEMGE